MKCPKIEAIQSKTRGRLGHFCNNSALDYSYQKTERRYSYAVSYTHLVPADGREGAGHLLDVGGVHLDDVPINRHLAEISADPLCMELGHLLFYQGPFLCCHRAAQDDGPFAVCHSVCPRFIIRVWDYPSKQFLCLGARGSLNRKFASVATLAVLALRSFPRKYNVGNTFICPQNLEFLKKERAAEPP